MMTARHLGPTVKSAAGQQNLTGNGVELPQGVYRQTAVSDERRRAD